VQLAPDTTDPVVSIRVASGNVYWVDEGFPPNMNGSVKKVPVGGGTPTDVAAGLLWPEYLAIDSTSAYVTAGGSPAAILKVPLAGGTPVSLCEQAGAKGIEVDSTNIYWGDWTGDGIIGKLPVGGGTITTLAIGLVNGFALGGSDVYWSDGNAHGILSVPIGGGSMPTTIASGIGLYGAFPIALDATDVYFVANTGKANGSSVQKVARAGGSPPVTLASGLAGPVALAVDSSAVYWADGTANEVLSVPLGGGPVTTLATSKQQPQAIAVDSTSVYWSTYTGGIWRLTPK
jgi:hypothetical protein